MTTDTLGGVWTYTLELCRALRPYGTEIHLIALGGHPSATQREEIDGLQNIIFYKSGHKLEWMKDPWNDVQKTQKMICRLCEKISPDILHFNNYMNLDGFRPCPIVTVYHSCVQTWWQSVKKFPAPSDWNPYLNWVRNSLDASDIIIFPTNAMYEEAMAAHSFRTETQIIHNARGIDFSTSVHKEKFILCTGRIWDEAKNLGTIGQLAETLPWPVYIAGDNVHPDTGRTIALKNVRFLGKLSSEEMKYWMERTEIYASPAKYEPFGLAVLEAAKAGCALAISNIPTLRELWGNCALFFDPDDPGELKKTLLRLIEHPELRKGLKEKSRTRALKYNLKQMGASYFQMYKNELANWEENKEGKDTMQGKSGIALAGSVVGMLKRGDKKIKIVT